MKLKYLKVIVFTMTLFKSDSIYDDIIFGFRSCFHFETSGKKLLFWSDKILFIIKELYLDLSWYDEIDKREADSIHGICELR